MTEFDEGLSNVSPTINTIKFTNQHLLHRTSLLVLNSFQILSSINTSLMAVL